MGYVAIQDSFGEHEKIEQLTDKDFRAFIRVICWASRRQTDGHIPLHMLSALRMSEEQVKRMVEVGVIDRNGDGGWVIHDYLDHNPPKDPGERRKWYAARRQKTHREKNGGPDS